MATPVSYFEIPVADLERAISFYETVFELSLERAEIDGADLALMPFEDHVAGATGALARTDGQPCARTGSIISFKVDHIPSVLERALAHGGSVLYPKRHVGSAGYVAEIADTEGNRIALNQLG